MKYYATRFETPLGPALAVTDGAGALTQLRLLRPGSAALQGEPTLTSPTLAPGDELAWRPRGAAVLRAQLAEYFGGTRRTFELDLAPRGTAFQRAVWSALAEVPYGETRSYGAIAAAVGRPRASRAVGLANGQNPLWIVVPCHRIVGAGGELTGYGGGLEAKRALLELEGVPVRDGRVRNVPAAGVAAGTGQGALPFGARPCGRS